MKQNDHEHALPQIPLASGDLEVIGDILGGNIAYLRNNAPLSSQTVTRIQELEKIRVCILVLQYKGDGQRVEVSRDDLLIIRAAMITFVQLTRRIVPQSPERDETLKRVNLLRKHLEKGLL
jgi:hypothetical protein